MIVTEDAVPSVLVSLIRKSARAALGQYNEFRLVLAGGSLLSLLATPEFHSNPVGEYGRWTVFLADERFVPFESDDSNGGLIFRRLMQGTRLEAAELVRVNGTTVEEAAAGYETRLLQMQSQNRPLFDLAVLGMGPDGHIASLFPPLYEPKGLAVAVRNSPKPPAARVSLTIDALSKAKDVLFVVTGDGKRAAVNRVFLEGDLTMPACQLPKAHWLLDEAAGRDLGGHLKAIGQVDLARF